jgi:HEAT repeat protein
VLPAALAQEKTNPGDVAKEIQSALGKNDSEGFKTATARAVELYGRLGEKKGSALVGATAKGLDNKESTIGVAAAEALGKMPCKASAKALGRLLKVPPKPDGNRLPVHKAAIAACGVLAQPDNLKDLEKLLGHKDVEIVTAAGEALGGFRSIDKKKLDALIGRLAKALAGAEKKVAKLQGKEGAAEAEKVQSAINGALSKLTGQNLATSKDWTTWIKESKKSKE